MARTTTIDKQDIINDVHRVAANHEGTVRVKDYIAEGAFSLGSVIRTFGSAKNETFEQILGMESNDKALDDSTVRMLAIKSIKALGKAGIKTNTKSFNRHAKGINSKDVAALYGSFAEGVREMGFEVDEVAEVAERKPYTRKAVTA